MQLTVGYVEVQSTLQDLEFHPLESLLIVGHCAEVAEVLACREEDFRGLVGF